MENTASFDSQVSHAVKVSTNMSSWILRVFRTRDEIPMMTLFRSLVAPHLEYCCQLWCPDLLKDIRSLEAVQRSFTARISGLYNLNYWERLEKLKLFSVERRRERYIILYVHKILQNIVPNLQDSRFSIKIYRSVRGDLLCKIPSYSRATTAKVRNMIENSFAIRGPRLYNCLPAELRNFQGSFPTFKSKLDKFLLRIYDKPCTPGYYQPTASNSIIAQLAQMRADGMYP